MKDIFFESWAIALRDIKRGFNLVKETIIVLILLLSILFIGEGLNKIIDLSNSNQTYTSFFTTGIVGYFIAIAALSIGSELIIDKKGFIKLLLIAPISRISILFGKMFYGLIGSIKSYFVIAIILMFYLKTFNFTRLFLLLLVTILIVLLFLGIGFIISAFINKPKIAQFLVSCSSIIFLFFSGIIYPIKSFPELIKYLFYINPMTYSAEAIRYAITGQSDIPFLLTLSILLILSITFPLIGIYFYDKRQRM